LVHGGALVDALLASYVVIDSSTRATRRADLARSIGGTTLEPVAGKCERDFYEALNRTSRMSRVEAVLGFAATVSTGADAAAKRKRDENILSKPGTQRKLPSECELTLCSVANTTSLAAVVDSVAALEREDGARVVRPELLSAVKAALQLVAEDATLSPEDASWEVANARRQRARVVRNRSVGSTLLVKGLEFDHVVITPSACVTKYDWYVALTRGTRTVHVLSPHAKFKL
jgi:DNA helicase-2/ATP-dependent DNA helicase PcrA